ncbi:hypothetical protein [Dissulfurirhabdus thermomarina]|uniref:hypothetical protein n=1 Tax=Dissulfurirhabdus thermomarina TaxID=1765737 RepID=UPI00215B7E13|nr:hypothetical protein [Dissulfurirhabdus thermomarina]
MSWLVGEVDGPARAAASPPGGEAGEIKMSEMLTMASRVLESQTEYRQALAANIRAFHHAVEMEEEMSELKREFEAMRAEIGELKELILSIRGQAEPPKKSASA